MIRIKPILLPALMALLLFLNSCQEDLGKYERPEWLAGKLYTQILDRPELSTFARCVELTGYDEIINVSGSYTVFAPSNEAFNAWFADNPSYNSVDDVPLPELERLVRYHIVQNPWSKLQLRSLDVYGWIDTLDINNNQPKGFKRETLLFERDRKYGIVSKDKRFQIQDTSQATLHRRVATDSRKYAPIFFSEYFNIYDLSSSDYEFYFNRPFGGSNDIHYANGRIISDEIFSENGFVYVIDQVVEPLKNAYQFLSDESAVNNYTKYRDLVNIFPQFEYNQQKTFAQPGADLGLAVDSLFDLTFPQLAFNVTSEQTRPPTGTFGLPQNVSIRYHHGLMAPTNEAFDKFVRDYIQIPRGWGTLNGAPLHIKRIIANTYLSVNPIYPSDLQKGFYNGELDIVQLDQSSIVQKEFGSNSTFIGLNEAIVPRAFSSVTGPVYLQQGYSKVMYAIEEAGLLPALKRRNQDYMFFVESDLNTSLDSSLIYDRPNNRFSVFLVTQGGFTQFQLNKNDLRTLLLNHIASAQPKGFARKEYIPNLAGNFIIVNNETGEVSGTGATTVGYRGTEQAPEFPRILSTEADNGATYEIQNWFSFTSSTIFSRISTEFPTFHQLMRKAGLSLDQQFRYNFISNNEFYTIFIPSNEAIQEAGLNSLPVDELRQVLLFHFVQGELIFTDGNKPSGYYETARIDEKSTAFSNVYTQMFVEPGIDVIRFRTKEGALFAEISESGVTNRLAGVNLGTGQEVFPNTYNNAVIHQINKVLKVTEIDTQ
ncbi:MAG TPA: hypothetical protein ENN90_10945 [Mariniphaga anaerophila]|uniref:FAS1 domain-containing protein n=1 Tax=Mariniphaga anaerophila TaxID=1484053 RepID=A0A831PL12_9BACT|nr:hypothetical protein [Mariniphaga anaerophila]